MLLYGDGAKKCSSSRIHERSKAVRWLVQPREMLEMLSGAISVARCSVPDDGIPSGSDAYIYIHIYIRAYLSWQRESQVTLPKGWFWRMEFQTWKLKRLILTSVKIADDSLWMMIIPRIVMIPSSIDPTDDIIILHLERMTDVGWGRWRFFNFRWMTLVIW